MSIGSPWKRTSTRLVYENPWIRVREDQVVSPTGSPGIYGVVECRIATGIVALTDDLHVCLVGQYRYPTETYSWEIPEGGALDGEEALVAAQRELREEAGLIAKDWQPLGGEIHLSNCFTSERGYLFVARELSQCAPQPDETEALQIRSIPFLDCVKLVERGEIVDSLTIIAILRTARMLGM